jgi:ubiquinone/menaquinone biosynthesis C-methylase UbiE
MQQTGSDIRKAYDTAAQAYAEKFLTELQHKPFDRDLLTRFAEMVGPQSRVADLGCGPGHTTSHLASLGLTPSGVDLSAEMISTARSYFPNEEFAVGDFFDLPFDDESLAGVLAFYCIVHLERDQLKPAFAEIRRVMQPNGVLLLSFHAGSEIVCTEDFLETGATLQFFAFEVDSITSVLREAGFANIEALERPPYDSEYPSQRCYVFARCPATG